jgi:dynein heavy chain, axonemal
MTVEDFVEHLIFLAKLSAEVPAMETEYIMITKLYTIAKDFEVYVPPEDLALYQILPPSFQHLKVCVTFSVIVASREAFAVLHLIVT